MPLAETALASQLNRQHDKIAAKPRAPSQIEGFVEQHTYKCFFKASNAPVDPRQVEKVTVTVKLHADDSAADGNRAVTSKVNRPAISPVVNVGVATARRPPAGKVGSPKTGKKLFLAKGLGRGPFRPASQHVPSTQHEHAFSMYAERTTFAGQGPDNTRWFAPGHTEINNPARVRNYPRWYRRLADMPV